MTLFCAIRLKMCYCSWPVATFQNCTQRFFEGVIARPVTLNNHKWCPQTSPDSRRLFFCGSDSVAVAMRFTMKNGQTFSGKTDPVQFKGHLKQGPFFAYIKMGVLQAVFSSQVYDFHKPQKRQICLSKVLLQNPRSVFALLKKEGQKRKKTTTIN